MAEAITGTGLGLEGFLGRWSLDRRIEDAASGRLGVLTGEASFRHHAAGELLYEERGTLVMEGLSPLVAERRYRWRRETGNFVAVHFEDGRPFHLIDLAEPRPFDRHLCSPDTYEMTYDLTRWPAWECRTRVEGPRKDYRMLSRYEWLGPLDSAA